MSGVKGMKKGIRHKRNHIERYMKKREWYRLYQWRRYNISIDSYGQFLTLLAMQQYKCAKCNKPIDESGDLDHEHTTGKVRGILCRDCNRVVGVYEKHKWQIEQYLATC